MSTWQCGVQNNPLNKDDILNAYAALFKNTANGHVILYAGGERDSNNGNSFMGFWIFKGNVGCNPPGNFTGQHTDGDVLILSNFTGGGGTPLVQVYEWMNGGLVAPRLRRLLSTDAASGDDVCGEVNDVAVPARVGHRPARHEPVPRGGRRPDERTRLRRQLGAVLRAVPGRDPLVAGDDGDVEGLRRRTVQHVQQRHGDDPDGRSELGLRRERRPGHVGHR